MSATHSPEPSNYLQSLESKSKALKNFVEVPPSPPSVSQQDVGDDRRSEDGVAKLQGLVKQAYAHADGNTASGKWSAIPRLLRLGVTSGQRGRWIGARADLNPPTLRPGMEYINAETEEEWAAWEKRAAVKDRVEVWKEGVLTPSGGEVSVLSIVSKASTTTSISDTMAKSGNALGFTVAKRSRQAIGKPKQEGKTSERAPSPLFVFPESQIMTSTPIPKRVGEHAAESYPASHPVHSLAPDANDTPSIHYTNEHELEPQLHEAHLSLRIDERQPALQVAEDEHRRSPAALESPSTPVQQSVPLPLPKPAHTTPLKAAWSLPIPRPAQPSSSKVLFKRDKQPLNENGKRNFLEDSPLIATTAPKIVREASSSKKSRIPSSPSPGVRSATDFAGAAGPSTHRRAAANVPTLTELLASSPKKKSSNVKAKKMVPITSLFPSPAKGKGKGKETVGTSTTTTREQISRNPARSPQPPNTKLVGDTPASDLGPGLVVDDVPPLDLGSPTKSLSSIADSDSDEDAVDVFDKSDLLDVQEGEEGKEGKRYLSVKSPFIFKPLATSTQKEDISFDFEPLVTSTQKRMEAPFSSSQGIPVFNSQSIHQLDIARKVEDANRLLDKDLKLLSSEDKGSAEEKVDEEKAFEREMSGWVRDDSVDSD